MHQKPASETYRPWDPSEAPHLRLASTQDVPQHDTNPTQTLRFESPEVTEMLDRISEDNKQTSHHLRSIAIDHATDNLGATSDFLILHEIGKGGVGIVSAAEQVSLGRSVAIKQLRGDRNSSSSRFQLIAEAKVQARLVHPVIPPVHLIGKNEDGNPVLVMQLVSGECWTDLLTRDGKELDRGSEATLLGHLEILIRIGEAIAYAHEQGVIHRDIKPGNVMVGRYGEVYLVDWGLAEELDSSGQMIPKGFTGTPAYSAPEMIQRDAYLTRKTDLYLLGSTLCEILTGEPPHKGDSIKEVFVNINKGLNIDFPSWVPTELIKICQRMLDPEPSLRYRSANEILQVLREYIERHQSLGMLDRVRDHVTRLDQMVQQGESPDRIEDLGQICRAMLEALRVSLPEMEEISELHHRCTILMVNRMIEANNPGAARIMLESLPNGVETDQLREKVQILTARLLAKPSHMATNVQLMLTEQLVAAKQRIAQLEKQLDDDSTSE